VSGFEDIFLQRAVAATATEAWVVAAPRGEVLQQAAAASSKQV
jgi:hypothetical protein